MKKISPPLDNNLYKRVSTYLQEARTRAIQNVNSVMVQAYWHIGREIVDAEQKGKERAGYGKALIESLSRKLTQEYGSGWSSSHLWHIRQFYFVYKRSEERRVGTECMG